MERRRVGSELDPLEADPEHLGHRVGKHRLRHPRRAFEQEVPPELYAAVAETLVWAYDLDRKRRYR